MRRPVRPAEATGPSGSDQRDAIMALLISASANDHAVLQVIFDSANWRLDTVHRCDEAAGYLEKHETAVVICDSKLPDGDWKSVLNRLETLPLRPNLIVTSRLADEALWAEVLNLGGYDVLPQPLAADEVCRVVFLAWHEHHRRRRDSEASQVASSGR